MSVEKWRGRRREDGPCPACGHEQGTGRDWCGIAEGSGGVLVSCMRSGGADVPGWRRVKWDPAKTVAVYKRADVYEREAAEFKAGKVNEAQREGERAREREARERAALKRMSRARELWDVAVEDHPVALEYFRARGVPLERLPACARFIERCPCFKAADGPRADGAGSVRLRPGPCVVLAATNAAGALAAVQRIYLDPDNPTKKRTDCGDAKKALGSFVGAAIRFPATWHDEEESWRYRPGLVVCEGPETALAVWYALCGRTEVWSVVSTSGIASLAVPPAVLEMLRGTGRAVVFGGDLDKYHEKLGHRPGVKYALAGATKLRFDERGVRVGVALPAHEDVPGLVKPGPGMFDMLGDLEPEADGSARKSVDWLDVFLVPNRSGPAVVAKAMMRAAAAALAAPPDDEPPSTSSITGGGGGGGSGGGPELALGAPSEGVVHQEGDGAPFDADSVAPPDRGAALVGGEGGGGAGDVGGGGESVGGDSGGEIRIVPAGHLNAARAMLVEAFSPVDVATHPKGMEGRAHERFTVAYLTAQDQWMAWVGEQLDGKTVGARLGARWVGVTKEQMRGRVLGFYNSWYVPKSKPKAGEDPYKPAAMATGTADGIVAAMQADAAVCSATLPTWAPATFDSRGRPFWEAGLWPTTEAAEIAHDVIPMRDGLLEVGPLLAASGKVRLREHTPRYLSTVCLPYEAPAAALREMFGGEPGDEPGEDPEDSACGAIVARMAPSWLRCIDDQADGDQASLDGLQEWFGYQLTPDISLEAIGLVPGPPRSTKGTQIVALIAMLGLDAIAMTSFSAIGERFEAAIFRGRRLAIMSDAHVDPKHAHAAVERIKGMSAGDPVSTESKFEDKVPVEEIPIKFMIFTNTIPKLPDPSGALAARLVVLPTRKSFSGKEDRGLKRRVEGEGPGIFVWAVAGLRRLRRTGRFTLPADGLEMLEQFRRLSSPVMAFLKDCAAEQPESCVGESLFHDLYKAWADDQGLGSMSKERFFAELQAARPAIRRRKKVLPLSTGRSGTPVNAFVGIRPKVEGLEDDEPREVFEADELADFGFRFPAVDGSDSGGGSGYSGSQDGFGYGR